MSPNPVEDRLRDALAAVREQSIDAPPFGDPLDTPGEPRSRHSHAPVLLAAAAAVVVLVLTGALLLRGGSGDTADTASDRTDTVAHDDLIDRVVDECLAFQAAVPAEPLPGISAPPTPEEFAALQAWQRQYGAALDGADDVFLDVAPSADDEAWVDESLALLRSQQDHTRQAGDALDRGDAAAAHQELYVAIQFGNQLAFGLAEAGAEECDVRGVTRPTR